ncbi:hypothetical protein MK805_04420 [Shimazuella sp. AN120528]|uniref:hypothetical protein n=1 Tax=Shimazuella soli TaxID=1892854 RepID=UPI001F0E5867|nr:hypothetical protein [Shimazuella soli]MCH5584212.1 hypothetical protein [Shimazuella soli]
MKDLEFFLKGYKPSYYNTELDEEFTKHLPELMKSYPYIDKGIELMDDVQYYLFFQNDDLKMEFEDKMKGVLVRSPEFHEILGNALGYPPKAVRFYGQAQRDTSLKKKKVGLHYASISCSSSIDDIVENAFWLWNTYFFEDSQQKSLKVRIDTKMHKVSYRDKETLIKLQDAFFASAM